MAYTDIDVKPARDNVKYVEFALDCLPEDVFNEKTFSSMHINFLRELKLGDTIQLFTGTAEDGTFYVEGMKPDRTQIFQSRAEMGIRRI